MVRAQRGDVRVQQRALRAGGGVFRGARDPAPRQSGDVLQDRPGPGDERRRVLRTTATTAPTRVAGCVFDAIGVSSCMWRLLHNTAHHSFVNIRGADTREDARSRGGAPARNTGAPGPPYGR